MSLEITPITVKTVETTQTTRAEETQAEETTQSTRAKTEEELQAYDESPKESEKTAFDKISDFFAGIFGLKNTHEKGSVNYYEYEFKDVEHPETDEFKAHDEYMDEVMAKYYEENPKPESTFSPTFIGISQDNGVLKWQEEANKYREAQETIYRKEHPEYANQGEAWDNIEKQRHFREITKM